MFDNKSLEKTGITLLRNQIDSNTVKLLKDALDLSFKKHQQIQNKQANEITIGGVALNVLPDNDIYLHLLNLFFEKGIIDAIGKHYFKSKFILNSFSALDNKPNQPNFSAIVHRDIKCYSAELPLMMNVLVMLDDFTAENGATLLLPCSHLEEHKPLYEYFKENAIQAIGKAGDILLFNSNIWHSSAINHTQSRRRALPITFSKSFVKQLMDYPRCLGYDKRQFFSDNMAQLLGYDSRVPANLEEWYQPYENRFYKKDQD